MERELKAKIQFEKALKSMNENYQRKVTQLKYDTACKSYECDMKEAKQFCNSLTMKKTQRNLMKTILGPNNGESTNTLLEGHLKKHVGSSSYSTLANAN